MTTRTSRHQMTGARDHIVIGLLPNMGAVREALEALRARGISDDQIGLAMRQAEERLSDEESPSPTAQDATTGMVGGGLIGGLAGLLTTTGVVAIPGLAPLLAGGSLIGLLGATGASIVAASGLGAVAGGLVGALISINVPETAAKHYADAVHEGQILISVKTDGDPAQVEELLASLGATTDRQSP
ncbi:MAG TPA: hypothetical protein PLY42_01725 [Nitrospira sp.]|nr:hypothetical protein [Nitrospira sp.]MBX7039067.1 hypothetical protein [Nitrospira sp.]HMU28846.1 hypothetical protein [Nitrospira sp.]HMW84782.1 hypothetical protein [Nitrospira sp.]HMX90045.1 hypothetical protein [Nitrospira sp.]